MRIAILGTGYMATTLAKGFLAAGHSVTFGSRDPEAHPELPAPVAEQAAAIDGAELVVSALQAAYSLEALTALAEPLAGQVLLDIGNAVTEGFELIYPNESLGEKLQAALPRTRVVKSLNTLNGAFAIAPSALPAPSTVFLSGDDTEAKALVSGLLADLGWPAATQIDLGGIRTARGPEHYFIMFATMMQAFRGPAFNIAVVR